MKILSDNEIGNQAQTKLKPLISVIVPCYNHGTFITECLISIFIQTYSPLEIILIDDGSQDDYTKQVIGRWSQDKRLTVIQQPNYGPATARNVAISYAKGRYILPVDADNYLAPDAIENLYNQINQAPTAVKFIYQNQQFFGNRNDYAVQPEYNLFALLQSNFCDTCALIDRAVFDEGFKFRENIGLGHEDWDFFLQLAEKGYYGQVSPHKNLFYRKQGFTRSDSVTFEFGDFQHRLKELHPNLYRPSNLLAIKRSWSPALSLILDWEAEVEPQLLQQLVTLLAAQTCQDFEVIIPSNLKLATNGIQLEVKQVNYTQDNHDKFSRVEKFKTLIGTAHAKYQLAWAQPLIEPFQDVAFIEKAVRLMENSLASSCVVLLAAQQNNYLPWRPVKYDELTSELKQRGLGVLFKTHVLAQELEAIDISQVDNHYAALVLAFEEFTKKFRLCLQWRTLNITQVASLNVDIPLAVTDTKPLRLHNVEAEKKLKLAFDFYDKNRLDNLSYTNEYQFRMRQRPLYFQAEQVVRPPKLLPQHLKTNVDYYTSDLWYHWSAEICRYLFVAANTITQIQQLTTDPNEFSNLNHYSVKPLGQIYYQQLIGTKALICDQSQLQPSYYLADDGQIGEENKPALTSKITVVGYVSPTFLTGKVPLIQMVHYKTKERIFTNEAEEAERLGFSFENFLGFIEPLEIEPRIIEKPFLPQISILSTQRLTLLYEAYDSEHHTFVYSLHPDQVLKPGLSDAKIVAQIYVMAEVGSMPVYELYNPTRGKYIYSLYIDEGIDSGFALQKIVGYFTSIPSTEDVIIYRHHNRYNDFHRLTLTPELSHEEGYYLDGPMGHIQPPLTSFTPLYRWYNVKKASWYYTTATETPLLWEEGWQLEGVLGLVQTVTWYSGNTRPFYQLTDPQTGEAVFSIASEEYNLAGYTGKKVLAYIDSVQGSNSFPLFKLYSQELNRYFYTANPHEREDEGFKNEGIVGYLDTIVPAFNHSFLIAQVPKDYKLVQSQALFNNAPYICGLVRSEPLAGDIPLYKIINPKKDADSYTLDAHNSDEAELVGYLASRLEPEALPLYRLLHQQTKMRCYTSNPGVAGSKDYTIEQIAGYFLSGQNWQKANQEYLLNVQPQPEKNQEAIPEPQLLLEKEPEQLQPPNHIGQSEQIQGLQHYLEQINQERTVLEQSNVKLRSDLEALQWTRSVQTSRNLGAMVRAFRQGQLNVLVIAPLYWLRSKFKNPVEVVLDTPRKGSQLTDTLQVSGWATSRAGLIANIEILLDGQRLGYANYGFSRPDVIAVNPWRWLLECGYSANISFNANEIGKGQKTLTITVTDIKGNRQQTSCTVLIK